MEIINTITDFASILARMRKQLMDANTERVFMNLYQKNTIEFVLTATQKKIFLAIIERYKDVIDAQLTDASVREPDYWQYIGYDNLIDNIDVFDGLINEACVTFDFLHNNCGSIVFTIGTNNKRMKYLYKLLYNAGIKSSLSYYSLNDFQSRQKVDTTLIYIGVNETLEVSKRTSQVYRLPLSKESLQIISQYHEAYPFDRSNINEYLDYFENNKYYASKLVMNKNSISVHHANEELERYLYDSGFTKTA